MSQQPRLSIAAVAEMVAVQQGQAGQEAGEITGERMSQGIQLRSEVISSC